MPALTAAETAHGAVTGYLAHALQGAEIAAALAPPGTGAAARVRALAVHIATAEERGLAALPDGVLAAARDHWAGRVDALAAGLAGEADPGERQCAAVDLEEARGFLAAVERLIGGRA
jgi:hypothetical protein